MFLSLSNFGLLLAVVAFGGREASGGTWHYSDAEHWKDDFASCGGKQQSPVNINRFSLQTGVINPIIFQNYDVLPEKQTVTNDGHTARYNFAQYHFHWGSNSSQGSEHTVDTVRYPMELHLVHFNNKYQDIATAVTKSDGLAVLGIFFVISSNDNPALAPLLAAIEGVGAYGTDPEHFEAANMYALASLLPSNTKRFFRYDGSLTTPPCAESVLWTVFEEPIEISEAQMEVIRAVKGPDLPSFNNFRPTQALNNRKVGLMSEDKNVLWGQQCAKNVEGLSILLSESGSRMMSL